MGLSKAVKLCYSVFSALSSSPASEMVQGGKSEHVLRATGVKRLAGNPRRTLFAGVRGANSDEPI